MPAGQNQGLQVAVIIFVILTVLSMGFAVMTATNVRELKAKAETERQSAANRAAELATAEEDLLALKRIIGMTWPEAEAAPDRAATETFFQEDLKKYGERLKAIDTATTTLPATYRASIDALLLVADQRNQALEAEKVKVDDLNKQKAALEGTYQAQVDQFKTQADAAEKARAEAVTKADAAEKAAELTKTTTLAEIQKITTDMEGQRANFQKEISLRDDKILGLEAALKTKTDYIESKIERDFAATYDGQVTKINPSTRTVWINLGNYDNLQKHLTFSVQPQGVPPGSNIKPKGRIEVIQILDSHLAECRILEDDLNNPILAGDNIYTPLWEPGQRTRFAFAGKIDLDDDGSDDIDRVRALVAGAGGQIDAIASPTGQTEGDLTIETRYLVLGPIPAQREGITAYDAMLKEAETLGVQRVPVAVFLDQIGYRRQSSTVVFGGGAAKAPRITDLPDGGVRESIGSVNKLFQQRRPPTTTGGSAYSP
jgi:hypothetical protein